MSGDYSPSGLFRMFFEIAAYVAVALFFLTLAALTGCASTTAEATYGAQLQSCVSRAATRAEADACIAKVDARWTDAGGGK